MSTTVSIGLLFPTGPVVSVDNVINCNEGTISVGGYLGNVPAGSNCHVIAKVYSGTPYTGDSMPAAPPQNLVESGEDFPARADMMYTPFEVKLGDVLCAHSGAYPDVQLLIWASLEAETPGSFVYSKRLLDLKGVAIRPTEPPAYPKESGL